MRARIPGLSLLLAAAQFLFVVVPRPGGAVTQVHGSSFAEDSMASRPGDEFNLFQTGVNLDVVPPAKKNLRADLNMRFNYIRTDERELTNISPLGNIGLDLTGEAYNLNLQQSRYATVSTTAQLTDTAVSRAAFSLVPRDLPHLSASVSRTDSQIGSNPASTSDTGSLAADYRFRWLLARAGVSADRRRSTAQPSNESSTAFAGLQGTYEVLPATVLSGDLDVSRFAAESAAGARSTTNTRTLRLNADSRPLSWFGLIGNFSRTVADFESASSVLPNSTQQFADVTANVVPYSPLRLSATVGNRQFNDVQASRSVDFTTLSASFSRELRERMLFGATASRNYESDPSQGTNTTVNLGANAAADLTSRIALRINANVSHAENRAFVSARAYGATGTLAERDQLDRDSGGLPPGFTFFDTVRNDLYTKNSTAIGDWTLTAHIEPVVGQYAVNRSVQINAIPTDRTSLSLNYASNASSGSLELGKIGSQSLNGSLSYLATLRSNLGLSGTASLPERGSTAYAVTGSYSYRFSRGHQLSLSYGRQLAAGRLTDTLSTALRMSFRKRTSLEITYFATQLFREQLTQFARLRVSHSF